MEQKVREALAKAFIGSEVELDTLSDGRYSGLLIWAGFEDQDSLDRHQRVKQALVDLLKEDAENVGIFFTYTPREMAAMRAA
jgi:acid stress-induced BolA-like protein IbaG/YrbA